MAVLATAVGTVALPNPVMTASGTAGTADELGEHLDLGGLGAFVAKSLAPHPWAGNPPPRLHPTTAGMVNSIGLQGPGVERWLATGLPRLRDLGARVVASIWGARVDEYAEAARMLRGAPVIAIEANLSCPNLDGGRHMFCQSESSTAEAVEAATGGGVPVWAKLGANVADLPAIAAVPIAG